MCFAVAGVIAAARAIKGGQWTEVRSETHQALGCSGVIPSNPKGRGVDAVVALGADGIAPTCSDSVNVGNACSRAGPRGHVALVPSIVSSFGLGPVEWADGVAHKAEFEFSSVKGFTDGFEDAVPVGCP